MLKTRGWEKVKWGEASAVEEYFLLWGYFALHRPKRILEIGTSTGIGAAAMMSGARIFGGKPQLTTIDIKGRMDIIVKNFNALGVSLDNIDFLVGDSRVLVPKLAAKGLRFDVCFIDGCHENGLPAADWSNTQKLTDMWILHDSTQFDDVRKLVKAIRYNGKYDVMEFSRYPFGHQYKGDFFVKGTIPGITLVRRRGTMYEVGKAERKWVKENKH